MSKKYVPPFLRQDAGEPAAFVRPTYSSKGAVENLVNTSQAAKEVTPLAPTTVFSRTARLHVHVPASSEFPSIKASHEPQVPSVPKPMTGPWGQKSFADLSKEWAAKQMQEEEEKKKEDQMSALLAAEYRAQKEKEEKEKKAIRALHLTTSVQRRDESDDEKYDLGGGRENRNGEDEENVSDSCAEEEDVEEEIDDTWERNRNKYDYY